MAKARAMVRTSSDSLVRDARADAAALTLDYTRGMRKLLDLEHRTDEEIRAAGEQTMKEAPMWVHALVRGGAAVAKAESTKPVVKDTRLNVILVNQATDEQAWLELTRPFQRNEVIEATVLPEKK